jgi:glutamate-1-semialdehyde 2,1-aminomutase
VLPGGVNSPVRAFKAVGGEPVFAAAGEGAYLVDADGGRYLDLVSAYGPLILGHAHPAVVEAIRAQAGRGSSFGLPTEAETELAEILVEHVPGVEMVRLVNSGTEAAMSAIRLARAATGRDLVVKFEGGYHGHADHLLASAGSGVATLGIPGSPGVPEAFTSLTAVLQYNSIEAVEAFFGERGSETAAVIVEPVAGNMGVVPGSAEFLAALRRLTSASGAVLIFDEVITGFRLGLGGAAAKVGITADLTLLGKVIGGGLPLAAYGGRRELMQQIAPVGPVYQAGTLSGNPLATAAGLATLRVLVADPPYARLESAAARAASAIATGAAAASLPVAAGRVGSMLTPFMSPVRVSDYAGARACDVDAYARVFNVLLASGLYPPPSQFECWFISVPLADDHVDRLCELLEAGLAASGAHL